MYFSQLIYRNLLRRRVRSLLTLLGMAAAVGAVVSLRGVAVGFVAAFQQVYAAHGVDIVVSRQGAADRLSSSVDESFSDRLQVIPEIERVAGVLLDTLSLEDRGIFGIPAMGLTVDSWMLRDFRWTGSTGGFKGDGQRQLLLGVHLADRLQVQTGDELSLLDERFQVVGIFESSSIWENGSMILPLTELQRLTDRQGTVTYLNVVLKRPVGVGAGERCLQAISRLDPRLLALATAEFVQTDTRMHLASTMAWLTSLIALVIGTIGTLNSMLTSVYERTQEIGILRAIGWSKRRVMAMILLEACGLALVAGGLGVTATLVFFKWLSFYPTVRSLLPTQLDFATMIEGLMLALAMGLLGAWIPAWRAVRMLPTEAFRHP